MAFQTPIGEVQCVLNSRNEVAALTFECQTAGWPDALRVYSDFVAPIIDHLAFV